MASTTESQLLSENEQLRAKIAALEDRLAEGQSQLSDLEQIYQLAPVGLCLADTDNRFVRINRRLAAMNGRSVESHIGASLRDVIPDIAPFVEEIHQRVFDTGEPVLDVEVIGATPSHPTTEKAYQVSYFPMKNGAGEVTGVSTVVQDVSKLKKAQNELLEQSTLLEQIIDNVPHSIFWKDRNSVYLGCNKRTARDLGLAQTEDVVGLTDEDTSAAPEQIKAYVTCDRQVVATGQPILDIEERQRRPDGSEAVLLTSKVPVCNAAGEVTEVVGIYTDITERKHAQQALLESEQRLRTIIDYAPEAIVVLDADTGRFVDANENAERLFGLDREALLKVGPGEMSAPVQPGGVSSRDMAQERIAEALEGGSPTFEWTHFNKLGNEVPCEVRLVRLPMTGRNLLRGSVTDITERKEAQGALKQAHDELEQKVRDRTAALAQSEEKWRSLVTAAPDTILILEADGTIRYINRAAQGFDIKDVIGTSAYAYFEPDDRASMAAALDAVINTGEFRSHEAAVKGADGSVEWYSSRIGPFLENGKITGVTSISTTVTQRKVAEQQLIANERLLRQLLDVQELERKMVASDIHDGFMQYAIGAHMHLETECGGYRRQGKDVPTEIQVAKEHLYKAMAEGRRMISEVRPMIIDEDGVISAIEYLISDDTTASQLEISFTHDVQFGRLDSMLESTIFRIVQEALNNVKRHAQTDRAEVLVTQRENMVEIEIRDKGVGFDLRIVPGERFGLRGIQERARLFGGKATISSTPGKGTRVVAQLPLGLEVASDQDNP